jgi:hypothetical protein
MTVCLPRSAWSIALWWLFALGAIARGVEPKVADFHGSLGKLREDATLLGKDWKDSPGLIIEDVEADSKPPQTPEEKTVAEVVAALRTAGVVAAADYTYMTRKQDPTPDVITVRVLVFSNAKSAAQWWDKKYATQKSGQRSYRAVEGVAERAVDSTEVKKRIALVGNVLIACSQLKGTEEYPRVVAHYVEKVASLAESKR